MPRKTALDKIREEQAAMTNQTALATSTAFDEPVEVIVPKKRGRKPKNLTVLPNVNEDLSATMQENQSITEVQAPKKRGRKPKDISEKLQTNQQAVTPVVEMPKERKKPGPKPKNIITAPYRKEATSIPPVQPTKPIVAVAPVVADVAPPKPATHNVVASTETIPSDIADNVNSEAFKKLLLDANQRSLYDLDWWFQIPKKERFRPGDVIYDTAMDRFGLVIHPARKIGLMRVRLLKVGSKTELYTRDWFLKLDNLTLVKRSDKLQKGFAETEDEYLRRSGRTLRKEG
jgi:hypothetical protein